jgi:RluA family pseudouridine synthase
MSDLPIDDIPFIYSRSQWKKYIKKDLVFHNDRVADTGTWVENGDEIEVRGMLNPSIKPYELTFDIIYEDKHMLAVHKPSGLVVSGNKHRTLDNAVISYLGIDDDTKIPFIPRSIHRLDSVTSGIVLIAKTYPAMLSLQRMMANKDISKTYLAVVHGNISKSLSINFPIGDKEATTTVILIKYIESEKYGQLSFVKVQIETGRTHQIRIHLNAIGHPIVGDKKYNRSISFQHKGLMLHAWKLEFAHPMVSKELRIHTDIPKRYKKFGISHDDLSRFY